MSYDCWHGAYSAFSRWRDHLAEVAGYPLKEFRDDSGYKWTAADLPWDDFRPENYMGDWTHGPVVEDPLIYLLVHSDCDGVIQPEEGRHVAARLEQLLPLLDESKSGGHIASMTETTQRFIDGLRRASTAAEPVVFW